MNQEVNKKQRIRFFVMNVTAFAAIFLLLGFIILQLLQNLAYQQTDHSLEQMQKNTHLIEMEIARYEQNDPLLVQERTEDSEKFEHKDEMLPNRFNTQIILWSKDGKILNKEIIGGRLTQISQLSLDKSALSKIQTLNVDDTTTDTPLTFHSITFKNPTSGDEVAYIQVVANTNQISESMKTFKTILIACMVIFWLISIAISYYLSKKNMQPILSAWQRQQEFVENASHELRTPLTIIQNSLQRLFTKPDHTIMDESETIAQALNETRRLTSLTADLLTIARSDSNQLLIEATSFDPQAFIAQLAAPFQEIAELEEKHFTLENFAKEAVYADQKKIHQVLVILLDNALKYTQAGDEIILQSELSKDDWLIEVKNSGPSISDEHKQRIFERFYREDASRSKQTGGYGLGLTIAKQIVTQHHGKISVRDRLPRGVIFQVKLPRYPKVNDR
ncbi:sensor histidine kinase [Enterococcus columbae]|uniref:histidine kinase n=1 Tax=Enterococcus columbae DSM 7374 = ATCC 51263 TaxID=1121865 RepID=S1NHP0_9ENTE|nr:ATP-binding protein [Enterococcus columbae]EOT40528.1 hypothetical protein OMW_01390 [Enterococcus columbae DSM 7374 = ATCC 51263]EOW80304.1 hypothetical protein I568_02004 [Enterococcus columbae DSM 7374 = ATCC 51263]